VAPPTTAPSSAFLTQPTSPTSPPSVAPVPRSRTLHTVSLGAAQQQQSLPQQQQQQLVQRGMVGQPPATPDISNNNITLNGRPPLAPQRSPDSIAPPLSAGYTGGIATMPSASVADSVIAGLGRLTDIPASQQFLQVSPTIAIILILNNITYCTYDDDMMGTESYASTVNVNRS
jgi:hypothetical protein